MVIARNQTISVLIYVINTFNSDFYVAKSFTAFHQLDYYD